MKKLLFVAFITLLGITQTEAQVSFRPGIRGGLNFAHFTKGDDYIYYDSNGNNYRNLPETSNITDLYLGLYGALKLGKYYTLQPEINYSRQGSYFKSNRDAPQVKYNVSYISVAVGNKFNFTPKFNVHLGPTIDVVVDNNDNRIVYNNNYDDDLYGYFPVDFTFFFGAGYNFTKSFGIEGRIKKGILPVFNNDYNTNVVLSLGATYTFDAK